MIHRFQVWTLKSKRHQHIFSILSLSVPYKLTIFKFGLRGPIDVIIEVHLTITLYSDRTLQFLDLDIYAQVAPAIIFEVTSYSYFTVIQFPSWDLRSK